MLIKFGSLIVLIMILVSQISDYGKLKSQTTKLSERSDFEFNIQDQFPLMGVAYFYIHDLIPLIKQYQKDNPDYPKMLLQMHYNSYTQQQIDYVEKFICDNSRMTY